MDLRSNRYEIEGDAPEWEEAEKQLRNVAKQGQGSTAVSVKSNKAKRKAGTTSGQRDDEKNGQKGNTTHRKTKRTG